MPALEGLEDLVLAPGAPVGGDRAVAAGRFLAGGRPLGDLLLRPGHEGPRVPCRASVLAFLSRADSYMEMVAHCLAGLPDEACGLLAGPYGGDEAAHLFRPATWPPRPCSTRRPQGDAAGGPGRPRRSGPTSSGVFHSHTHTDAYPSPTDVAQAPDPGWHYVLVSLRDTHPVVRSYRIVDGQITEEPVEVPGLEVLGLGLPGRATGPPACRIVTRSVNNHPDRPRGPPAAPRALSEEAPWPSKSAYRPSCAATPGARPSVSVDGATVGEVLSTLVAEYPGMSGQVLTDGRVPCTSS